LIDEQRKSQIQAAVAVFAGTRTDQSFSEGRWSVSHLNFIDEVKASTPALPPRVTICDITLSRFSQTAGIHLSKEEMKQVAVALDRAGVPMLDVSLWYGEEATRFLEELIELDLSADLVAHIGYNKQVTIEHQIEKAQAIGLDFVTITTGPNPAWDKAYRGKDVGASDDEVVADRARLVAYAKERGLKVRSTVQYPTYLQSTEFLQKLVRGQADAGADVVLLADHGGLSPATTKYLISLVRDAAPSTPVGLHYHDSLGLGIGCSLAAVEAGASLVEVTINGVGSEGHTDLAQLAVCLESLYGVETGVKIENMKSLYELFAELSGYETWRYKPLVGESFFELSSDLVSRAVMIDFDPYISTPVVAEALGGTTPVELGMQSGPILVARKAAELGMDVDDVDLATVVEKLHAELAATKSRVDDDRLVAIIREAQGTRTPQTASVEG
jgi:isopropylmalate/homocitrate/citramalate synthase